MATLIAGSAFDMNDMIATGSLSEFFEWGEVQVGSSTDLVVTYSDETISEELHLTGDFQNYDSNGFPTTGTVSSASYTLDGVTLFTVSGMTISVEDFTAFVMNDDLAGLFQTILSGDDSLQGSSGGDVLGGRAGNDTIDGGDGNDTLLGGGGNDVIHGDAGDDFIASGFGNDTIDGGDGYDVIQVDADLTLSDTITITGSTADMTVSQGGVATSRIFNSELVQVWTRGDIGTLTIDASSYSSQPGTFLWMIDHNGTDVMIGSSGAEGFANIDVHVQGNDIFTGNGGADIFDYTYAVTGMNGDTITDFDFDDVIDLSHNGDVEVSLGYARADTFIGSAAFSGVAGEYRFSVGDGHTYVEADTDGDAVADQVLTLSNGQYSLVETAAGSNILVRGESIPASEGDDTIEGTEGADLLEGFGGDDTISGLGGDDTLRGGTGNDTLFGGTGNDLLSEASGDGGPFGDDIYSGGGGYDRVSYFTTDGLHGLTIDLNITTAQNTGQGNDRLVSIEHITSNYGNDTLTGNAAANWFWTFSGFDTLSGNGGNDYFTVGADDKVVDGGDGIDTIEIADFSYAQVYQNAGGITVSLELQGAAQWVGTGYWTLSNIENLGGFSHNDHLTGDSNANVLLGHIGNDTLNGGGGNDSLYGDGTWIMVGGVQTLVDDNVSDGPGGDDVLNGGAGNDYMFGGRGNDILDGGTGRDQMVGGAGDDVFYVDDYYDEVIEVSGEGTDAVFASANFILGENVEKLTQTGTVNLYAYGNSSDNILTGNSGISKLFGLDGNDTLDGGAGSDRLFGGLGDDIYYVDSYSDRIIESDGEGTDSVFASDNAILDANVENITLTGSANIWAYGNELDNALTGNSGNNKLFALDGNDIIDGGAGADKMWGDLGDDTYYVDNYNDRAIELAGEGIDTVFASANYVLGDHVEKLTMTGSANLWAYGNGGDNVLSGNGGANKLYGLSGDDTLRGRAGNDLLEGGAGRDVLFGESGADTFVFNDGDFAGMTSSTCDQVKDFSSADGDRIRLSGVDANTLAADDQAFAFIGTGAFSGTAGELRYDQISGTTYVYGDTNGDSLADFMIRLDGAHTLTSGDFVL
ncbi:MAG TPA: calcium-binding protein [Sphingomicrobium sp.]|nr:calcium-binding protein [Sphingomicrobium sp.]